MGARGAGGDHRQDVEAVELAQAGMFGIKQDARAPGGFTRAGEDKLDVNLAPVVEGDDGVLTFYKDKAEQARIELARDVDGWIKELGDG